MTATPLRPAGTSIRVVMTRSSVAGRSLINVDQVNVDTCTTVDRMSRFVGAGEAARLLGIQKATLYAYVSRGLIERRVAVDGRTSLYAVDDVESLAGRGSPPGGRAPAVARRADRHRRHHARRVGRALPRPRRRRALAHRHLRAGGRAAVDRRRSPPTRRGRRRSPTTWRRRWRSPRRRRRWRARPWSPSPAPSACATRRRPCHGGPPPHRRAPPAVLRRSRTAHPVDGADRRPPGARRGTPIRRRRSAPRSTAPSSCWPTTSWPRRRSPCGSPARRGPVRTSPTPPGWRRSPGPYHGGAARPVHQMLEEAEREGAARS